METGEIPLEELLARYEEGNRLLIACARRLHNAEQRIEKLKQEREGLVFENLDPDES